MNEKIVVQLKDVSASYFLPKAMVGGLSKIAKKPSNGMLSKIFLREIEALNELNITFYEGQRIGIVGANGSGKSTLLKCIAGAMSPTKGSLEVNGTIASVLSLSGGISGFLSGRANATNKFYNCVSPALPLAEFLKVCEESANLGAYFDMPVSTYSSGMKSRLDKAMLNLIDGEIFLFDEWVGVGDKLTTSKDNSDNQAFLDKAKLVLLASHSEQLLREWTNELIWIHEGHIKEYGDIDTVLKNYQDHVRSIRGRLAR